MELDDEHAGDPPDAERQARRRSERGEYKIPFLVVCDAFQSETTAFADLVLPDTTYLERHDVMSMLDRPISEFDGPIDSVRVPVVPPTGRVQAIPGRADRARERGSSFPRSSTPDGTRKFRDYPDFIVNYETEPGSGIGFLSGWRGKDGDKFMRGEPNPRQWEMYEKNNCVFHHKLPPSYQYMRNWNRGYMEWAQRMRIRRYTDPILIQIYSEVLQKFRLAAQGKGNGRKPPAHLRVAHRDLLRPAAVLLRAARSAADRSSQQFPLRAITQRPMAMYHAWDSQNAWLRQIHAHNHLFVNPTRRARGRHRRRRLDVGRIAVGQGALPRSYSEAVEPGTVWTWNAIGKAAGAWHLAPDANESRRGFLLNHLITDELPGGRRRTNFQLRSDHRTGGVVRRPRPHLQGRPRSSRRRRGRNSRRCPRRRARRTIAPAVAGVLCWRASGKACAMTQLALVIDLNVCVGCHACVTSCKEWNTSGSAGPLADFNPYDKDPTGTFFNRVQTFEVGEYPDTQTVHFPKSCLHCEDPPCVPVCPTGASYKRAEDGIVLVDYDKCIGCKYCAWACPYGVRELDEERQVMTKCTLCVDRINDETLPEAERKPACVLACPTNARLFGDIHDPRFGRVEGDPRERRLRADARMGDAPGQPLSAAAQDRAAPARRRAHPRRQSAQGRRPAAEAAAFRSLARRSDVVVREAPSLPALDAPCVGRVPRLHAGLRRHGRHEGTLRRESEVLGDPAHDADRRGAGSLRRDVHGRGRRAVQLVPVADPAVVLFLRRAARARVHRRGARRLVLPPGPARARVALGGAVAHLVAVARSHRVAAFMAVVLLYALAHFLGWNGTYGSPSGSWPTRPS